MTAPPPSRWLSAARRLAPIEPAELAPVAWAFAQFACVLTATFVLRAARDEMGIQGGVKQLPWMFTATFLTTVALVPAYGWISARLGRRALAIAIYGALAATMFGFWAAFVIAPAAITPWISRAAFVWLSVINMIAVAAFWSSIVDVFTDEQGTRLFGIVAAGGTVGALCGPSLSIALSETVGPLPSFGASGLAFLAAVVCAMRFDRVVERRPGVVSGARPIGGDVLEGLRLVATRPELRGIAIYVAFFTTTATVVYMVQGQILDAAFTESGDRYRWLSRVDLATNVLAIVVQLALTAAMMRRLALGAILVVLPALTVGVFLVLGAWPTLGLLAIAQTVRRACEHAVAKPGRELLYARLERDAKFKGQNAVDTVVYRGSDAISSWAVQGVASVVAGVSGTFWAFTPLALVWVWWGWRLGRGSACGHDSGRQPVDEARVGSIDRS